MGAGMSNEPVITLDWVRREKAKHKAALSDLEATERVLLAAAAGATPPKPTVKLDGFGAKKRTLLTVIADSTGLATVDVIKAGGVAGLKDLKTENVSPQLSAAKSDGLLSLDDGLWRITQKGREYLTAPKS